MNLDDLTLLEYYKRERTYLRKMGAAFAEQYPKVAGRLELGLDQSPDPHIERLIESFAFLTARIQYDIESDFPRISTALLSTTYPQFLNPVPSMTTVRFEVDPTQGKLTSGHEIPKGTPLTAPSRQGPVCRFRTCYNVVLWPVEVVFAGFESINKYDFLTDDDRTAIVLRLRIQTLAGLLDELEMNRLRFHLHGDRMLVYALYEILFTESTRVVLLPENSTRPRHIPGSAIQPVGFGSDEEVLPYPPNAHTGYRLLHELFTFPDKFLFFDLDLPEGHGPGQYFDLLFLLHRKPQGRLAVDRNTFRLGCTPAINLFTKTTEPIRVNERRTEYLLIPDKRREKSTEIHSILSVSGSSVPGEASREIPPFFSFNHAMDAGDRKVFYYATRKESDRADLPGSQIYLSFVDLDFDPGLPPTKTVYARTLCTNRDLAGELPAGALFQFEQAAPLAKVYALTKPTLQIAPPIMGPTLWKLISHLSLNFLSMGNSSQSLAALKEILRLYNYSNDSQIMNEITGLRKMKTRPVTRRVGREAWRGFCQGYKITLTFDEQVYTGASDFLMASVLNHFFPLYASINSFTQLVIKSRQREEVWKVWPPMVGEQVLL